MKKRGKDISPEEKAKLEKERKTLLAGVEIHVMPESFAQKKATVKEPPKPAPKPKPKPKPVPKPAPKPKPKPAPKKKSKAPWVILGVGVILIAVLAIGGYFMVQSLQTEDEVTDDIDGDGVLDDDDNCPEDANASQADVDDDGIGDVCDPTDDRPVEEEEPGPGVDTDSDGLTDVEEDLYGTDDRDPDTDGDSFLDGNEVFHRYSPLGEAPQTLLDTGAVAEFIASDGTFQFTYPTDWDVSEALDQADGVQEITLDTDSSATITLTLATLEEGETFEDWYDNNGLEDIRFSQLQETLTKEGYLEYMSNDELTTFVVVDEVVYTFIYDLRDELTVDFLQTFQMLINSFVVTGV